MIQACKAIATDHTFRFCVKVSIIILRIAKDWLRKIGIEATAAKLLTAMMLLLATLRTAVLGDLSHQICQTCSKLYTHACTFVRIRHYHSTKLKFIYTVLTSC
jgi:hypothetical protein